MTIREELDRIIKLHKSINRKLAQRHALQDMATSTAPGISDTPGKKNPSDRVGHLVQRMVDLEAEADKEIDRLADMKEAVKLLFACLPDARHRDVMELRYLECLEWSQVAKATGYYKRHALRLHSEAVALLENSAPDNT
jgi:DNA-directed RNA polymerase specialized sigma subunit